MKSITLKEIFDRHGKELRLEWVAGQAGEQRVISTRDMGEVAPRPGIDEMATGDNQGQETTRGQLKKSLVGHLNIIHPHKVQILGRSELNYLNGLRRMIRRYTLRQLEQVAPECIIVAEGQPVPQDLLELAERNDIPLWRTPLESNKLTDDLQYYLSTVLAEVVVIHGVFMEVMALGVLLTGPSGIGKSELALELISRGHRLVADDAPEFSRIAPGTINGICPPALQDFLEVRGLGVINVRELFGASAIKINKYLRLIIRLEEMGERRLLDLDRLRGSYATREVLGIEVPEITIPVAPGRNLAVLVESAARNHMLRSSGYDATAEFIRRQGELMEEGPR